MFIWCMSHEVVRGLFLLVAYACMYSYMLVHVHVRVLVHDIHIIHDMSHDMYIACCLLLSHHHDHDTRPIRYIDTQ